MSKKEEPGKSEVSWTERKVPVYKAPGERTIVTAVNYTTKDLPPRTVYIEKEDPDDEEIKKAIKEDLEKRRKPEFKKATL